MMKKDFKSILPFAFAFTLVGLALGWLFFHGNCVDPELSGQTEDQSIAETIYTCAMHPQIRQNEPGDCPICGMELVPVAQFSAGTNIVEMSVEAAKLSNIQTSLVSFTLPEKEIYLQGKVQIDERRVSNQTSKFPGRIDKLYVSFTGESVIAGNKLVSIYSTQMVSAQKELFEAIKVKANNPILYRAARNKMKQWKFSDSQIDAIEKQGTVQEVIDIRADISGVVLKRNVSVGDFVNEGSVLFTLADLNKLWVEFDAYEADIPWLKIGDEIVFNISSIPGVEFKEKVTFIDPVINVLTRTVAVRLEVKNKEGKLKPEMFASGKITAKLPINEAHLTVPKSAVMWTGKRSVVYVSIPNVDRPMYEFREVTLGPDLGAYFIIDDGLTEGEMVVTNGAFKVDAAAQLAGKQSMMNRTGVQNMIDHKRNTVSIGQPVMDGMEEVNFKVSGNCDMCKSRIESSAQGLEGVKHAVWDKESKMITVHFDPNKTNKDVIAKALAAAGHDNEYEQSSNEVYNELPACCQYTRH